MENHSQNSYLGERKPSAAELSQGSSQDQVDEKNPEHINLRVEFPEGEFTNFKIKRVTKMEKLMKAFYAQKGLQPGSVRLLLDDRRIHPNDTAETLNAEEGDVINVYSEQAGGNFQGNYQSKAIKSDDGIDDLAYSNSGTDSLAQEMAVLISLIQEAEVSIGRLKRQQQEILEKKANMEKQVKSLTEILKSRGKNMEEISKQLEKIEAEVKESKGKIEETRVNTEHIVDIAGSKIKEKKPYFATPAAVKLASLEARVLLVAREDFFLATKSFRSLDRDLEKLVTKSVVNKVYLEGNGILLASDFHTKQRDWGEESQIVLVIDGVEDAEVELVSPMLAVALKAAKERKVLVVAGPTTDKEKESSRQTILDNLSSIKDVTPLNMTEVARKIDESNIKKFVVEGSWSPLAIAYLFSMAAWWAEKNKRGSQYVADPVVCPECGLVHSEAKDCLKEEISKVAAAEEVVRKEERGSKEERGNNKEERGNNNNERGNNNNKRKCEFCGNGHRDECWYKPGGRGGSDAKRLRKGPRP